METLEKWELKEGKLYREYTFEMFLDAISFINKVAEIANRLNHHPEIWNNYNKVTLTLFTHDENAVTEKDRELAEEINKICGLRKSKIEHTKLASFKIASSRGN